MAFSATETSPVQSIAAGSTATSTTPVVLDNGGARANHSAIVTIAGTLTAGVVTLEVSNDNANWTSAVANGGAVATPAGFSTGTGVWALNLANFPAQYVRAAITTAITGGTVGVTVASA